ncbi:MAG: SusF/SusE family outer membrane protein [Clostridia bacterium]|nr:SusF/SusE family outer membrane protein [Clostridia bacterium]
MKKVLVMLLAAVLVLSLAACSTASSAPLKDDTHELWVAHGQYLLADGTQNSWDGKDASLYEASALKAISLKDVKSISEELYNTLSGKQVKYLYTIDLIFGTNDAGWNTNFLKDGVVYKANGSYAFKVAQCNSEIDGETKVYSEEQWISDPKTANVESLTPKTVFYPVWQETPDEYGFSWASNPVVIGGAGLYTLVIAQYTTVSAAGQPGYGVGLVLKEAKDGIAYEEVPSEHTYGIVGSFAASDWGNAGADVQMTASGENTWVGEVELKAGEEFKVRVDGDWAVSYGPAEGGNFKAEADGTYVVTLTIGADGNGTVTFALK